MKKIYCVLFGKYRKFKNCRILFIFQKALVISTICNTVSAAMKMKKLFKEEEPMEILHIFGLVKNIWLL